MHKGQDQVNIVEVYTVLPHVKSVDGSAVAQWLSAWLESMGLQVRA